MVAVPGIAMVAATLRTRSRAPASTTTRTLMVSPPSGVAAADTRCTVSASVRRPATPPEHSMLGTRSGRATINTSEIIVRQRLYTGTRSCSCTQPSTGAAVGSSVSEISTNGRSLRTLAASRRITSRSAPTIGARSVLLITSRSE